MQINTNINVSDNLINTNEQGNTKVADIFEGVANYNKDIAGVFSDIERSKRNVKSENYSGNIYGERGYENSMEASKGDSLENQTGMIKDALKNVSQMITPEGYSQMSELGITPTDEEPDKFVGVYERIQIELATYCEDYNATFLNVSSDKIKEVVGDIPVDFDGEMKFEALRNQIEKIMDSVGVEVNEENLSKVKQMLIKDIPVTEDTIVKTVDNNTYDIDSAVEVLENASSKAIEVIVNNNYRLNISNLRKYGDTDNIVSDTESITTYTNDIMAGTDGIKDVGVDDEKINSNNVNSEKINALELAKKTVYEAAAVLTKGALMHMQKLGININFAKLSDMIEHMQRLEDNVCKTFLSENIEAPNEEQIDVFKSTISTVYKIEKAHIRFIAEVEESDTLAKVGEKATYAPYVSEALDTYESLGTKIRPDLGDSISKAFRNVDSILQENGFELNDTNRQVARILGYNMMEINEENMETVKEKLFTVDYVVKNLTPKTVSYLISNNINPMNKDLNSLAKEISEINNQIGDLGEKSYAKYLYKLEKTENISDEDRKKYISFFRTLHEISKKDTRAIGAIVDTNSEFTIENMLKLSKSYKVVNKIDVLADTISKIIDPSSTKALFESTVNGSISLENALDVVRQNIDVDLEKQYMKEQTEKLNEQIGMISDDEISELLTYHIPVNIINLSNTFKLKNGNRAFNVLDDKVKDDIESAFLGEKEEEEDASGLNNDDDTNKSGVIEKDDQFTKLTSLYERLSKKSDITATLEQSGMLKTLEEFAKRDNYFIPLNIEGNVVNVHLRVNNDMEKTGVDISIKESEYGEVNLMLTKKEHGFDGMLTYGEMSAKENIENLAKEYMGSLKNAGIEIISLSVVQCDRYTNKAKNNNVKNKENSKTEIQNRVERNTLFRCAKLFIREFTSSVRLSK